MVSNETELGGTGENFSAVPTREKQGSSLSRAYSLLTVSVAPGTKYRDLVGLGKT